MCTHTHADSVTGQQSLGHRYACVRAAIWGRGPGRPGGFPGGSLFLADPELLLRGLGNPLAPEGGGTRSPLSLTPGQDRGCDRHVMDDPVGRCQGQRAAAPSATYVTLHFLLQSAVLLMLCTWTQGQGIGD